jgi:hypothetical protein
MKMPRAKKRLSRLRQPEILWEARPCFIIHADCEHVEKPVENVDNSL